MDVLVVEDHWLIAAEIEHQLSGMGHAVMGPAPDLAGAFALLRGGRPDAALLDVSLGADRSFPVADALLAQGIPFAFVTSCRKQDLPEAYRGFPLLRKPFAPPALGALLAGLRPVEAGRA